LTAGAVGTIVGADVVAADTAAVGFADRGWDLPAASLLVAVSPDLADLALAAGMAASPNIHLGDHGWSGQFPSDGRLAQLSNHG